MTKIQYDVNFTAGSSIQQISKLMDGIRNAVAAVNKELEKTGVAAKDNFKAIKEFRTSLGLLAVGDPSGQVRRARNQGAISTIRNQEQVLYAELVNALVSSIKTVTKAAQQDAIRQMVNQRQRTPGDSAREIRNQIVAQEYRLTQAPRGRNGRLLYGAAATSVKEAEERALGALKESLRLLEVEKRLKEQIRDLDNSKFNILRNQIAAKKDDLAIDTINRRSSDRRFQSALVRQKIAQSEEYFGSPEGSKNLFDIQSRLLFNYQVLNTMFNGIRANLQFVVDFDTELRQLQAISATTNTNMEQLAASIIKVSESTKFTAVEVAQAATVLAQAGFSTKEIVDSMEGVTLLATATGSTLKEAVDVATSSIGVFNMQASEMGLVTNIITAAINQSKLTMEKFALGLQYAANVAADTGIQFTELTATLAAYSNSGIRSGSTLGTGLRQLIIDLQAPTDKLVQRIKSLGLTMEDVDIRTNGLVGVLKNLRQAGFTTADAMATIEVRAANAFSAISRQLNTIEDFRQSLILSQSAAEANDIQMQSFSNTVAQFRSVIGTVTYTAFKDLLAGLAAMVRGVSSALATLNELGPTLTMIGTIIGSFLVGKMASMIVLVTGLGLRLTGLGAAAGAAATGLTGLKAAVAVLGGPVTLIVGLLTAAVTAFTVFGNRSRVFASDLEISRTALQNTAQTIDSNRTAIGSVNKEIDDLILRSDRLRENQDELKTAVLEARVRFGEMGLKLSENVTTVEELIRALQNLRGELSRTSEADLSLKMSDIRDVRAAEMRLLREENAPSMTRLRDAGYDSSGQVRPEFMKLNQLQKRIPSSFDTQEDAAKFLNEINALIVDINNARQAVEPSSQDFDELGEIREAARKISGRVSGIMATFVDETRTSKELVEAQFELRFGNDIKARIEQVMMEYQAAISNLPDGRDPNVRAEAMKVLRDQISRRFAELTNPITAQFANNPQFVDVFERTSAEQIDINITQATQKARDFRKQADEFNKKLWEQEQKSFETEIEVLLSKLNPRTTIGEANNIQSFVAELLEKAKERRMQLARVFASDSNNVAPSMREDWLNLQEQQANIDSERTMDRINNWFERLEATLSKDTTPVLRNFSKELRLLGAEFETIVQMAQRPVKELDARIDFAGTDEGRRQISQTQVESMRRRRSRLSLDADRQTLQELNKLDVQLNVKLEEANAEARTLRGQIDDINSKLNKDNLGLSDREANALKAQLNAAQQRLNQLVGESGATEEIQNRLNENMAKTIELTDRIAVATSRYSWSLNQEISTALDNYLNKSVEFNTAIGNAIPGLLDAAEGSFKSFFDTVVTGADSVKGAFKTLTVSILKSMLDVVNSMIARRFMEFLINLVGASFGGSGGANATISSDGLVTGGGFSPRNNGGFIRANMGKAIPTRDSVPILARPGEYVLRNAAVDAIGRENLDMINAMGNRVVQSSRPPTGIVQQREPDMVSVYVVAPGEKPQLGPKDIVAVINEDIVTGGQTRRLIKQVAMGAA